MSFYLHAFVLIFRGFFYFCLFQVFIDQLSLVKRYLETHWNELFYPHRRMNQQGLPSEDAVIAINATKVEMVCKLFLFCLNKCHCYGT